MTNVNALATARANALESLTIEQQISVLEAELRVRAAAVMHLKGIPARQNSTEIAKLYDVLVDLNIRKIEGGV